MSAVTKALFDQLRTDATLTSMLSQYQSVPAIFARPLVPENAVRPYVWIQPPGADESADTKTTQGRTVRRDIWAVTNNQGSMASCEAIAERIRSRLHRQSFAVDGAELLISEVSGPSIAPSDESVIALSLGVRLVFEFTT